MKLRKLKKTFKRFLKKLNLPVKNGEIQFSETTRPLNGRLVKEVCLTWESLIEPNYEAFNGEEDYLVERYEFYAHRKDRVDVSIVNVWLDDKFNFNENFCGSDTLLISGESMPKANPRWA